jgi:hypothetical protein
MSYNLDFVNKCGKDYLDLNKYYRNIWGNCDINIKTTDPTIISVTRNIF